MSVQTYQIFKNILIERLQLEKDRVLSESFNNPMIFRTKDYIFNIVTEEDEVYQKLLSRFSNVIVRNVERLIGELCVEHCVDYRMDEFKADLIIKQNGIERAIELKVGFASISNDRFHKMFLPSIPKDLNYEIVLLHWKTSTTIDTLNKLYMRNTYLDNIEIVFLEDFIRETFGEDEWNMFKESMDDFKEKMHEQLGYQLTEICNDKTLQKFKNDTIDMLKEFPFSAHIRQDINQTQKDKLRKNFFDENRYEIMVSNSDFADSFISSEWYYSKYQHTSKLEQTGIVAGYLKSVEQLIYRIILHYEGTGLLIKQKGNNTTIELSEENMEQIDFTLGALIQFLKYQGDLFDTNSYVKHYISQTITDWKNDKRNGHFHKLNLNNWARVEEIRNQTILLYYLILGGIKMDESLKTELIE